MTAMPAEALARSLNPSRALPLTPREIVRLGRDVVKSEAIAVLRLARRLDRNFYVAAEMLYKLDGSLIVTGVGKAGLIGQKLAATFASTGTRAHFVHPGEAMHGDLGRIGPDDLVLLLSYSGESPEVTQVLPPLAARSVPVIAVTRSRRSTAGRAADVVLELGEIAEACLLNLAPTSTTAAMLALGDALALVVSRLRSFQPEDFARFHPGGSLGRKLSRVDEQMRPLAACRLAPVASTVRQVLVGCSKPGRRSGAVMLTDDEGRLAGLFTDSDLARLFEHHREAALDGPITAVMTPAPCTVASGTMLEDAVALMAHKKISELPVVGEGRRPVGMLDVTDLVETAAPFPQDEQTEPEPAGEVPNVHIFPIHQRPSRA
jgi:arabinose-5-phosphate isomerase